MKPVQRWYTPDSEASNTDGFVKSPPAALSSAPRRFGVAIVRRTSRGLLALHLDLFIKPSSEFETGKCRLMIDKKTKNRCKVRQNGIRKN